MATFDIQKYNKLFLNDEVLNRVQLEIEQAFEQIYTNLSKVDNRFIGVGRFVGEIMETTLTVAQLRRIDQKKNWVEMNGSSIEGTALSSLTGIKKTPNRPNIVVDGQTIRYFLKVN